MTLQQLKYITLGWIISTTPLFSIDDATLDQWLFGETNITETDKGINPASQTTEKDFFENKWDKEIILGFSTAHNKNILQSTFNEESDVSLNFNLDAFISKLPGENSIDFYTYLFWEHTQFPDSQKISNTDTLVFQTQFTKKYSDNYSLGGLAKYNYFDQIYDVSSDELDSAQTQTQSHQLQIKPFIKLDFKNSYYSKINVSLFRSFFNESINDYTEPSINFLLGKKFGHKSKTEFSYNLSNRYFDKRTKRDIFGTIITDTKLRWLKHKLKYGLKYYWDKNRAWQSRVKSEITVIKDNGTGYNDYIRYKIGKSLRYQFSNWEFNINTNFSYYDYDIQQIDTTSNQVLDRTVIDFTVFVEKKINEKWAVFSRFFIEKNQSNRRDLNFESNTVTFGINKTF